MAYSPAGDLIQSIGDAAGAMTRELQSRQQLGEVERLCQLFDEMKDTNAANLAEKIALRTALTKLAPKHPLITNKLLQEKIQEAGRRAIAVTDDWDAVREAGATFRVD